jgi:hypothetical protein
MYARVIIRTFAIAVGWVLFTRTAGPTVAFVAPGLYFNPEIASVGQHVNLVAVDGIICSDIAFSLAPADQQIDSQTDTRLTRVPGTVHTLRGLGANNEFSFRVPQLAPGAYFGYDACKAVFQRSSNQLSITPTLPPTDTAAKPVIPDGRFLLAAAFSVSLLGFGRALRRRGAQSAS